MDEQNIHQAHSGSGDNVGRDKIENLSKVNSIKVDGNNNFIINGSDHNNIEINISVSFDDFAQKYLAKKDREIDGLYARIAEITQLKDYQLKDIAGLNEELNRLKSEKKVLETQVKELLEKGRDTDFSQVGELYQKAFVEFLQGNIDTMLEILNAEKLAKNETELFERQSKERRQAAQNRILRAKGLVMKFKFAEAEENYQKAVSIEKSPGNIFDYALFLQQQNQFTKAQPLYEEALKIYRELARENPQTYLPFVATTLNNLAALQQAKNEFPQALEKYEEALKIRRELARENPQTYQPDLAMTVINLSIFYLEDVPDKEKSIALAIETLEIAIQFPDHYQVQHYAKQAIQVLQAHGVDLNELMKNE